MPGLAAFIWLQGVGENKFEFSLRVRKNGVREGEKKKRIDGNRVVPPRAGGRSVNCSARCCKSHYSPAGLSTTIPKSFLPLSRAPSFLFSPLFAPFPGLSSAIGKASSTL